VAYDTKTAERVRAALSEEPVVIEKRLMGGLCFMVNGAMCCSVSGKGGLLIRVGPTECGRVLAEPHVQPMEMRGRTMTGFVRISPEGYRTDAALNKWIRRGVDFVKTLPPKPSRKKSRPKK
jgi:TfoX-like protein